MAHPPLVSVITPTRDRPDMLARLLDSIEGQTYPSIETLVVDDGSTLQLSLGSRRVHILRNSSSQGFCLANNLAFQHARGEFFLLLNDDAELADDGMIQRAVTLALAHPTAGAIAFAQLLPSRTPSPLQPASATGLVAVSRFLGYACLLRRDVVEQIGGFNPVFGAYYEDIEMSMRIMQAGKHILYDPELQVVHHEDARHRDFTRIHRLTLKNAVLTALLRYPWFCVPVAVASYLLNFVRMTRGHEGMDYRGAWWALRETSRQWRHIGRERNPLRYRTLCDVRRLRKHPVAVVTA